MLSYRGVPTIPHMRSLVPSLRAGLLALCLATVPLAHAASQAPRAGAAVFGGLATPGGSSGQSYGAGGAVGAGVGMELAGSRVGFRLEGSFVRLDGAEYAGIDFPAVKMIPVIGSVRIRLRDAAVTPYLFGGAGAAFVHHNVSYDGYAGSFAGLVGGGARLGRGDAVPSLELRYVRVATPVSPTGFFLVTGMISLGRY